MKMKFSGGFTLFSTVIISSYFFFWASVISSMTQEPQSQDTNLHKFFFLFFLVEVHVKRFFFLISNKLISLKAKDAPKYT
jgi:hypothetical protein